MISRREFIKVGVAGFFAFLIALLVRKKTKAILNGEFPMIFPFSFPGNEGKFLYLPKLGK